MWLLLLGIHLVGLVGFNLTLRKSLLNKADPLVLATVMQTGIAIPLAFVLIIRPPSFSPYDLNDYFVLLVSLLLGIGLQVTNVKALQYLETGVFSVLYNLRILITTLLGILFLHEEVVWLRILGGLLILLAIIIVRQKGSKSIMTKGIEWGIAAAFVVSFLNLTEKVLINDVGILNYFPLTMVLAAIFMWGYLFYAKKELDKNLLLQPKMIQLMTLRAMSAYGFSFALAAGALISVGNYISGMSVILMVAMGAVFLKERDYLFRKILGASIAVAGLTIILLSDLL